MKPGHCTKEFYATKKKKVKTADKDYLKKSIKFFEKVVSKPLKSYSISSNILIISIVFYFGSQ